MSLCQTTTGLRSRKRNVWACALLLWPLAAGCSESERPLFREVALACGIEQTLVAGTPGPDGTILDVNGNGAALLDLEGDGDLDLVLIQGSTRSDLVEGRRVRHLIYLNLGVRQGLPRFEEQRGDTGLEQHGWPTGVAVGDVDRDGRPDLLVGGLGEDVLFLNRTEPGRGIAFESVPVPGRSSPLDWTTSVALADADGDGLLDAYLARYLSIDPASPPRGSVGRIDCRFLGVPVMCGPHGLPPQPDVFLHGEASAPYFSDASAESGIRAGPPAYALGVVFTDLDSDGHPDIYIANDSVDNRLLRNRGDGRFEDVSLLSGAATDLAGRAQAGMGVDVGDLDQDGDFELVVTNFSDESNALYRNDGRLQFRDIAAAAGLAEASRPMLGWGVHLADFNADGLLDLYVANGHVYPQADQPALRSSYAQPQQFFLGTLKSGSGGSAVALIEQPFPDLRPLRGRCSVRGDLDDDGDLDLVTLELHGQPRLYLNTTDAPSRHLLVRLDAAGQTPYGAVLRLDTDAGPRVATCLSSSGFQSASDTRLHFAGDVHVRSATITWPGGLRESLDPAALSFGNEVTIRRGAGVVASHPLQRQKAP
ncbi:MAG: CRTAC1 family protein [Planctomycetota bacterium]